MRPFLRESHACGIPGDDGRRNAAGRNVCPAKPPPHDGDYHDHRTELRILKEALVDACGCMHGASSAVRCMVALTARPHGHKVQRPAVSSDHERITGLPTSLSLPLFHAVGTLVCTAFPNAWRRAMRHIGATTRIPQRVLRSFDDDGHGRRRPYRMSCGWDRSHGRRRRSAVCAPASDRARDERLIGAKECWNINHKERFRG